VDLSAVYLVETRDLAHLRELIGGGDLLARISEDVATLDDIKIKETERVYLFVDKGEVLGFFLVCWLGVVTVQLHINILKEHRRRAMECARVMHHFLLSETDIEKAIAEVPVIFPEVCKFVECNKWKKEGVNRASLLKNGVMVDQNYYGITRAELAELVGQ